MAKNDIRAIEHLANGGVILCLTDTIWGLSADAQNEEAARAIIEIKERPANKSFIVLVNSVNMLAEYMDTALHPACLAELTENERPTTVILPNVKQLAPSVYAQDGTVGVRLCKYPRLNALIDSFGRPIISTSANLSGGPNPATYSDVPQAIKERVDYIVQEKEEEKPYINKPSRIVKWLGKDSFKTLRP